MRKYLPIIMILVITMSINCGKKEDEEELSVPKIDVKNHEEPNQENKKTSESLVKKEFSIKFDDVYEKVIVKTFKKPEIREFRIECLSYSGSPKGIFSLTDAMGELLYLYAVEDKQILDILDINIVKSTNLGNYKIQVNKIYKVKARKGGRNEFGERKFIDGKLLFPDNITPEHANKPYWSIPVNGLQFKVEVAWSAFKQGDEILFTIYLRNVGQKAIAVLDPSKLPNAEVTIIYYCWLFNKKRTRDYIENYRYKLEPTFKPEWYTILKPNEIISGELLVKHDAPPGKCYLVVAPYMIKPRENTEGKLWDKEDFNRIVPLAWTNTDQCREAKKRIPELGPFKIEIIARKKEKP